MSTKSRQISWPQLFQWHNPLVGYDPTSESVFLTFSQSRQNFGLSPTHSECTKTEKPHRFEPDLAARPQGPRESRVRNSESTNTGSGRNSCNSAAPGDATMQLRVATPVATMAIVPAFVLLLLPGALAFAPAHAGLHFTASRHSGGVSAHALPTPRIFSGTRTTTMLTQRHGDQPRGLLVSDSGALGRSMVKRIFALASIALASLMISIARPAMAMSGAATALTGHRDSFALVASAGNLPTEGVDKPQTEWKTRHDPEWKKTSRKELLKMHKEAQKRKKTKASSEFISFVRDHTLGALVFGSSLFAFPWGLMMARKGNIRGGGILYMKNRTLGR
jgi:hypothetical protein